jgi:DNA-binding protein HU-beta
VGVEMNKADLIEKIAENSGLTKSNVEKVLDATLATICKSIKKGEEVKLVGFGTFSKTKRKARNGRNPKTGEAIKIPSSWSPKFKPGSDFKEILN